MWNLLVNEDILWQVKVFYHIAPYLKVSLREKSFQSKVGHVTYSFKSLCLHVDPRCLPYITSSEKVLIFTYSSIHIIPKARSYFLSHSA